MDWKRLDRARRDTGPIEIDLIEAYAQGKISRRNFVKRGTIIGLSVPFMGSVIAACGGDDDDAAPTGTDAPTATDAPTPTAAPTSGGEMTIAIQTGDANSGLDPLNMLDLGTYAVLSQSFEYLVGLADDGGVGPTALATSWSPNDDGSVWTFNLREGVAWQDGSPFTSADVVATIERMVEVGAGLAGVVGAGGARVVDDLTVEVGLESPNGNLPVLLSIYNPQSLITPADYASLTRLDERPAGTGAWVFEAFNPSTFEVSFTKNPNWWGGDVLLDRITLQGFDSGGTAVAAMSAREVDMIQQFAVTDGANLLTDDGLVLLRPPAANHRQLWFNTQLPEGGPFTDPRVRQAVGYCLNREQMVQTLFRGEAIIANDHPVHPAYPFFDDTQEQRPRDIEMAKQLLSDAGYADGIEGVLEVGDLQEIPNLAAIVQGNVAEAGINVTVNVTPNSDFYGEFWCTGASWGSQPETGGPGRPCGASAAIGIVDYGHRPTPDVYFGRALETDGDWNSSNYASPAFDDLFKQYQAALDVEGQKAAVGQIQRLLHEDMPAAYPYFYNYISAHDAAFAGVRVTALGHVQVQGAGRT